MNWEHELSRIKDKQAQLRYKIEFQDKENDRKKVLEDKLADREKLLTFLKTYKSTIAMEIRLAMSHAQEYRNKRISFLEKEIERNLALLLPNEAFEVKIEFDVSRDNQVAELYVGKNGNFQLPKAQNGRFVRQVISFTSLYTINELRGSKVLFMDESMNSGDGESLKGLEPVLEELSSQGFQITLIEHKHEMFTTLRRIEILLTKMHSDSVDGYIEKPIVRKGEILNDINS